MNNELRKIDRSRGVRGLSLQLALAAVLMALALWNGLQPAMAQTSDPGKTKPSKKHPSASAAARTTAGSYTFDKYYYGDLPALMDPEYIYGTGMEQAVRVQFSSGITVAVFESDENPTDEAMFALPVVDSPLDLTGPITAIWPDGTRIVAPLPYAQLATAQWWDDGYSDGSVRLVWLESGKYWMITGPWLGTATEVFLGPGETPVGPSVDFVRVNAERLLVPIDEFPASDSTWRFKIVTPYGDVDDWYNAFTNYPPALVNGIAPGKLGNWDVVFFNEALGVSDEDHSAIGSFRTRSGDVAPYGDFIYRNLLYVTTSDTGTGSGVDLSTKITDKHAQFLGPNRIYRTGAFTSTDTGRVISFTVVGTVPPGSTQYFATVTFTDTQGLGLGKLNFQPYLDEDVWDYVTDFAAMAGTPGAKDFILMNPDSIHRVGFGFRGFYTTTPGLMENATWTGFAIGEYAELKAAIEVNNVAFSLTPTVGRGFAAANISTSGLTEISVPEFYTGKAYYGDSSVAMRWTANPNAITATMTMVLQQVAADPTVGGQDARAANIVVKNGAATVPMAPGAFVSETTQYSATQWVGAESVQVTPTLVTTDAFVVSVMVIQPGGGIVACSSAPYECPLAPGLNTLRVIARSGNNIETYAYRYLIFRPSSDARLIDLKVNPPTLAPAFVSTTHDYLGSAVENGVTTMTVTAKRSAYLATYTLTVSSGACSSAGSTKYVCPLEVGWNTITTTVTALDGTTVKNYAVRVLRRRLVADQSTDNALLDLAVGRATVAPAFVSTTQIYSTSESTTARSVLVTPTVSDSFAGYLFTSSPGTCAPATGPAECTLQVGLNTITVTVTAENGTEKTYVVFVTRVPSGDANLDGLTIAPGTLAPAFASSTAAYTVEVPNGTTSAVMTATTSDVRATVTYESSAGSCAVGNCAVAAPNTWITVTVTAEDGTTKPYFIEITVAALTPTVTPTPLPTTTPTPTPGGLTPTPTATPGGLTPTPTATPGGPTATPGGPTATPAPLTTIDRVWPGTGLPEGGMPVQIFGTGFSSALTVTVGPYDGVLIAVPFTIENDARIRFVMPEGVAGQRVSVTVATADSAQTAANAFTYVQPEVIEFEGNTGGVFTTTDGVVVTIPSQGITGTFFLTMTPLPPAPGVPGNILMYSFRLDALLNGLKLELLTNPVTITLPIDEEIFAIADGERPWLYSWMADGRRPTAVETTDNGRWTTVAGGQRSAVSGQWILVRGQEYDAGTRLMTVALRPMGVYALSAEYVRAYWLPLMPVLK